jgi:hypothetical protein
MRAAIGYVGVATLAAVGLTLALATGQGLGQPRAVGGSYRLQAADPCLGPAATDITLSQSGLFVTLGPGTAGGSPAFELRLAGDQLTAAASTAGPAAS